MQNLPSWAGRLEPTASASRSLARSSGGRAKACSNRDTKMKLSKMMMPWVVNLLVMVEMVKSWKIALKTEKGERQQSWRKASEMQSENRGNVFALFYGLAKQQCCTLCVNVSFQIVFLLKFYLAPSWVFALIFKPELQARELQRLFFANLLFTDSVFDQRLYW